MGPADFFFLAKNLSKHHVWNNMNGYLYVNMYVSEAAIPHSDSVIAHLKKYEYVSHLFGI